MAGSGKDGKDGKEGKDGTDKVSDRDLGYKNGVSVNRDSDQTDSGVGNAFLFEFLEKHGMLDEDASYANSQKMSI